MTATQENESLVELSLVDVIDQMTARAQAGETVPLEELIAAHPRHADELRRLWPAMAVMAELSRSGDLIGTTPVTNESIEGNLGDFQIIREVGRGGMGVVYEATQISLNRRVALKVLPFAATMDPRHLQRFKNEALAAASLEHPNIVPVYGVGCERGVHFYAMKFIEGRSLTDIIHPPTEDPKVAPPEAETVPAARAATVPMPRDPGRFRQIAQWIIQAAEALEHAHSLGIVHRDIKPGNLLIDGKSKLWVTDFGLARIAPPSLEGRGREGLNLTVTGDMLGTLRYMSPEQALAKHGVVDHRTDVYSLGVTLYELLSGKPAVPGDDKQEVLRRIAFEESAPPRAINSRIPKELETITLKAIEKDVVDRYSTAKDLAADLRRWLTNQPIHARPAGLLQASSKWARRHKHLVATTLAVALLVIVLQTIGLIRERGLANEARTEGERARKNLRMALVALGEASNHFVDTTLMRSIMRSPEEIAATRKLLAHYEDFVRANDRDPELRWELTNAYLLIGSIASTLIDNPLPRPWVIYDPRPIDRNCLPAENDCGVPQTRKALEIADDLLREQPNDMTLLRHRAHGTAQLARLVASIRPDAEQHFLEALRLFMIVRRSGDPDGDWLVAITQNQYAIMLLDANRVQEAENLFRQAQTAYEAISAANPADGRNHGLLGCILGNRAVALYRTDRFDEGDTILGRSINHLRKATTLEPRSPNWPTALHGDLALQAAALQRQKQPLDSILAPLRERVTIMQQLASQQVTATSYRFELAKSLADYVALLIQSHEFAPALPLLERAVTILEELVATSPSHEGFRRTLESTRFQLGELHRLADGDLDFE